MDMDADELEISRSTPTARFDAPETGPVGAEAFRATDHAARVAATIAATATTAAATVTATDAAAADPAPDLAAPAEVSADVRDYVERLLADREQPVLLFALEWCEFCWSVRKLFARCGIPYRSIDLDSAAFQRDDRGGQVRAVLREHTGLTTIPQVFVGGEFIGGSTATMQAFKDGRLQDRLRAHGVEFRQDVQLDPHALLPAWIHPR
jgi:cysteine synthase A